MIIKLRKKYLFIFVALLCAAAVFCATVSIVKAVDSTPKLPYTIVIDAGHGGMDGGCSSADGKTVEAKLNLAYAKTLEKVLTDAGFKVVLTRKNDNGLYKQFGYNYKEEDLTARINIIEKSNPTLFISIHMNSYPLTTVKGAQVFFKNGDDVGYDLAKNVQTQFNNNLENNNRVPMKGDFYMLNAHNVPGIIIEAGFLTNAEEVVLLNSDEYRQKMCYLIYCGILQTLQIN